MYLTAFSFLYIFYSVQIRVFMRALEKYPFHSYGLIDAPKTLADIVESTIGAIYVDSNSSIDATWEVCFCFFFKVKVFLSIDTTVVDY